MAENVFFSSDHHFGHQRILEFARVFDSIEEHDETLIDNWNKTVGKQDRIYHLGDFSFYNAEKTCELIGRLKGQIHFVRGNHDHSLEVAMKPGRRPKNVAGYHGYYKEIRLDDIRVVLMHFVLAEWHQAHHGAIHLHGHQHGNGQPHTLPRLDVGVDCFDFTPVAWEEVMQIMLTRTWVPESHH